MCRHAWPEEAWHTYSCKVLSKRFDTHVYVRTYVPIYTYVHVSLVIIQIHAFVASFGSRRRHALRYRTSSLTCIVRTTIFGYTMIWRWSTIIAAAYVPEKDLCDIGVCLFICCICGSSACRGHTLTYVRIRFVNSA